MATSKMPKMTDELRRLFENEPATEHPALVLKKLMLNDGPNGTPLQWRVECAKILIAYRLPKLVQQEVSVTSDAQPTQHNRLTLISLLASPETDKKILAEARAFLANEQRQLPAVEQES